MKLRHFNVLVISTKIVALRNNGKITREISREYKYTVSAMCRVLGIPRGLVYYKRKLRKYNSDLENKVIKIFKESKNNYDTRKIRVVLASENTNASRAKIGQIMFL